MTEGPPKGGHYEEASIRVGISACLLGQEVRYDGGHKRAGFLMDAFGQSVEWVPVCPEVEAGFGTPREPVRRADPPVPELPVEDESRLADPRLLEEFVRRVFAYHRRQSA